MQTLRKYRSIWLPPLIVLALVLGYWLGRPQAEWLMRWYHCPIHSLTGLLCPGCGGTRSLKALLQGRLLTALHENIAAVLLLTAAVLRYCERILLAFGKEIHLLPRKRWFWFVLLGLTGVWAVLRNFTPAWMPQT